MLKRVNNLEVKWHLMFTTPTQTQYNEKIINPKQPCERTHNIHTHIQANYFSHALPSKSEHKQARTRRRVIEFLQIANVNAC